MANITIDLDDSLKEQAQIVATGLGFDLSSAIRIFLTQMVKEKGFPFGQESDPFYLAANQEALRASLSELEAGKSVILSLDELRSME